MATEGSADLIDFVTNAPTPDGSLAVQWNHGVRKRTSSEPPIQVHAYDEHTFVLRQSKTVSYEAPFLYLLFGNERALLLDTGAVNSEVRSGVRSAVDVVVDGWLATHRRTSYELIVAHSHGHGDHVAGDKTFAGRPNTTVVGSDQPSVQHFFGFRDWPNDIMAFDLGGRVLEVTGTPGHHASAIAIYDPWSGFLLTGDSVYPGRLYVPDMTAYVDSIQRTVSLAESRRVTHVMGCHIEMTRTPRRDYPLGSTYQPDEPPLQMTVDQLRAVRDAAVAVASSPGAHVFDDFIIYNGPCRLAVAKQLLRRLGGGLVGR